MYYRLKGHIPISERSQTRWLKWFKHADRIVASTWVKGQIRVSTVFTGESDEQPPRPFETKVFGGTYDQEIAQSKTWVEAKIIHETMCEKILKGRYKRL